MRTGSQIRVVLADDHKLFREGLRVILSREAGIELVGEAAHGLETVELISKLQPDVVLLDMTMPGTDGFHVIPVLKQRSPETKPLILTAARNEGLIFRALKIGAKGYVSKDASISDLLKAIQAVHQGELWVERKVLARFSVREALAEVSGEDGHERTHEALTLREEEILRLLASGGANKDIAQALCISNKTVKRHLNRIFRKLHVTRRLQAVAASNS